MWKRVEINRKARAGERRGEGEKESKDILT